MWTRFLTVSAVLFGVTSAITTDGPELDEGVSSGSGDSPCDGVYANLFSSCPFAADVIGSPCVKECVHDSSDDEYCFGPEDESNEDYCCARIQSFCKANPLDDGCSKLDVQAALVQTFGCDPKQSTSTCQSISAENCDLYDYCKLIEDPDATTMASTSKPKTTSPKPDDGSCQFLQCDRPEMEVTCPVKCGKDEYGCGQGTFWCETKQKCVSDSCPPPSNKICVPKTEDTKCSEVFSGGSPGKGVSREDQCEDFPYCIYLNNKCYDVTVGELLPCSALINQESCLKNPLGECTWDGTTCSTLQVTTRPPSTSGSTAKPPSSASPVASTTPKPPSTTSPTPSPTPTGVSVPTPSPTSSSVSVPTPSPTSADVPPATTTAAPSRTSPTTAAPSTASPTTDTPTRAVTRAPTTGLPQLKIVFNGSLDLMTDDEIYEFQVNCVISISIFDVLRCELSAASILATVIFKPGTTSSKIQEYQTTVNQQGLQWDINNVTYKAMTTNIKDISQPPTTSPTGSPTPRGQVDNSNASESSGLSQTIIIVIAIIAAIVIISVVAIIAIVCKRKDNQRQKALEPVNIRASGMTAYNNPTYDSAGPDKNATLDSAPVPKMGRGALQKVESMC